MNKTIQKKKRIMRMEILQKVTLYDLLGYAVPGTCFLTVILGVYIYGEDSVVLQTDYAGYICGLIVLLGYIVGIVISEVTDVLLGKFIKRTKWFMEDRKELEVKPEVLVAALKKIGFNQVTLDEGDEETSGEENTDKKIIKNLMNKYHTSIYANIQTDSEYSRIHNYASAALICKNMAFVSFTATIEISLVTIGNWPLSALTVGTGIIFIWAFILRWKKNYWRKYRYTNEWFIQKYNGEQ